MSQELERSPLFLKKARAELLPSKVGRRAWHTLMVPTASLYQGLLMEREESRKKKGHLLRIPFAARSPSQPQPPRVRHKGSSLCVEQLSSTALLCWGIAISQCPASVAHSPNPANDGCCLLSVRWGRPSEGDAGPAAPTVLSLRLAPQLHGPFSLESVTCTEGPKSAGYPRQQ